MPPEPIPVYAPMPIAAKPGVQRDGTLFSQQQYLLAEWCRFYRGLPRKMLGYREQQRAVDGLIRQLDVQSYDGYTYVHGGTQDVLQRYTINLNTGVTSGLIDRTPASGFVASDDNNWQFSVVYNTATNANLLLAHAAPNILDITNTDNRPVFYGEVRDTAALLEIVGSDVSGGILAMWPYFLRFGNDGEVAWPVPGNITNLAGVGSGSARPWGTKIVRGLPLRGTSGPAGLLWALDAVIRVQFVGGTRIFDFDTITTSSALLSSNGIIEHNGIYYWATVSGFSMFNGVIRDIENEYNRQWFIDNLNFSMRQKVFAMKIPRWNEIWWCFPKGNSTECNHAVVYQYDRKFWYDTPLPDSMRTAGIYEQIYRYPIMASAAINDDTGGTSTWQHEFGYDEVSGPSAVTRAIRSRFMTDYKNLVLKGQSRELSYNLLEPDFHQHQDLRFTLHSKANARARDITNGPIIIPANPSAREQLTKFKFSGRFTAFEFESNARGGYYEMGVPVVHAVPSGDRRED